MEDTQSVQSNERVVDVRLLPGTRDFRRINIQQKPQGGGTGHGGFRGIGKACAHDDVPWMRYKIPRNMYYLHE